MSYFYNFDHEALTAVALQTINALNDFVAVKE